MGDIQYLHHVPGRLRVKCRQFHSQRESVGQTLLALRELPGVRLAQLNPHAASLIIHYDPSQRHHSELLQWLEEKGCLLVTQRQAPTKTASVVGEGIAGVFGKALMGALAQKTATRLIGALL